MKKIIFTMVASFLMMSCTNKTVEDWRNDESDKNAKQYAMTRGTYGSFMFKQLNGDPMGYTELILEPSLENKETPDGLGMERRSILTGSLTHLDQSQAQLTFSSGSYDYKSGLIVLSIPVGVGDKKIKFIGVISEDKKTITGTIEAEGVDPQFGGKVSLKRNAPRPQLPRTTNGPKEVKQYAGNMVLPDGGASKATLTISNPVVDPKNKFYNLFVPSTEVEVGLRIDVLDLDLSTPRGHVDNYFNSLTAIFETGDSTGRRYTNTLECTGLPADKWNCSLTHARAGESRGEFTRVR